MRTSLILFILICFQALQAESWQEQVKFNRLLTRVERCYQQGDQYLEKADLDSSLQKYIQARRLINELFFLLLESQKSGHISKSFATEKWEQIASKMRIKLPHVTDCTLERCYIYHEEKAANWCIRQLKTGTTASEETLMVRLVTLLEHDATARLKHFFGKIYLFLEWQAGWQQYQGLVGSQSPPALPVLPQRKAFIKAYQSYQAQQGR